MNVISNTYYDLSWQVKRLGCPIVKAPSNVADKCVLPSPSDEGPQRGGSSSGQPIPGFVPLTKLMSYSQYMWVVGLQCKCNSSNAMVKVGLAGDAKKILGRPEHFISVRPSQVTSLRRPPGRRSPPKDGGPCIGTRLMSAVTQASDWSEKSHTWITCSQVVYLLVIVGMDCGVNTQGSERPQYRPQKGISIVAIWTLKAGPGKGWLFLSSDKYSVINVIGVHILCPQVADE